MNADPAVLTSLQLSERLGISRSFLIKWSSEDATLAGCVLRKTKTSTYWSVARLRARGYLTEAASVSPVISYSWSAMPSPTTKQIGNQ